MNPEDVHEASAGQEAAAERLAEQLFAALAADPRQWIEVALAEVNSLSRFDPEVDMALDLLGDYLEGRLPVIALAYGRGKLRPGTIVRVTRDTPVPERWALLPASIIPGDRYELGEQGEWFQVDAHCADCAALQILHRDELVHFRIVALPVPTPTD